MRVCDAVDWGTCGRCLVDMEEYTVVATMISRLAGC